MATFPINEAKIKLAWREKYITDGVNQRSLAHPRGIYNGFYIAESGVPDTIINLIIDPAGSGLDTDQFAVYRDKTNGYTVSIRETGVVPLNCAGLGLFPVGVVDEDWYVYIEANYTTHATTTADYVVSKTDPHTGPNPDAVIIGVITMPAGAVVFNTPAATVSYARRTLPTPTAREDEASFIAGDEAWGLFDGVSKWHVPSNDEKNAMLAANTPDAGNPFATMDDVVGTTDKMVAEPTRIQCVGDGTATVRLLGPDRRYYVGLDAAATAAFYFDLRASLAHIPFVNTWDADNYQRLILVSSVHRIVAGADVGVLDPSLHASAAGGYPTAGVVGATDGIELQLAYEDGTPVIVPIGQAFDVWCGVRALLRDLDETPTYAFPQAYRARIGHSSEHLVQLHADPPVIAPNDLLETTGTNLRALQVGLRGTAFPGQSTVDVAAKVAWNSKTTDTYSYSPHNVTLAGPFGTIRRAMAMTSWFGQRYVCVSVNFGFVPEIFRYDPNDMQAPPIAIAIPGTPGVGVWLGMEIVAMCSDGRWLYVRVYDPATFDHWLTAVDVYDGAGLGTVKPGWPVTSVLLGTGDGAGVGLGAPVASTVFKSEDVIVADNTKLAVNRGWVDIAFGGAGNEAIQFVAISDGALGSSGSGDFAGTIGPADQYAACGPICSDGTNIYYSVIEVTGVNDVPGVFQLKIADPTTSTVANWDGRLSLLSPYLSMFPVSLVYDGVNVWQNISPFNLVVTLSPIVRMIRVDALNAGVVMAKDYVVAVDTISAAVGEAVFDGKYLYFGFYWPNDTDHNKNDYHLVRVEPGMSESPTDYTVTGILFDIIKSKWAILGHESAIYVPTYPFGAILFDGEDVHFQIENFSPIPKSEYLRRIKLVKFQQ